MAKQESVAERTEALLTPIAARFQVNIYDVEFVKEGSDWYLRAYIDKPEGVTIQDCEDVSRALSDRLDEEDFIEDAYILEVSSPGLGRILKKDRHLQSALGQEIELKTYRPVEGQKEFSGILKSFDTESLVLACEQKDQISNRTFSRKDLAVIRLALDF
ncbi:MAG: ribosome maturation factor RimP [Lachnospiraceae bacterium]|nr:ribosome maturation factor RimP [Lachnospiraceae bacterium]